MSAIGYVSDIHISDLRQIETRYMEKFSEMDLDLHYSVSSGSDHEFAVDLAQRKEIIAANPAFDPHYHDLDETNYFSLNINKDGQTIATVSGRLYEAVACLTDLLADGLFYKKNLPDDVRVATTTIASDSLSGKFSLTGRLWVDRRYRGRKLSRYLVLLARAKCFSRWMPDWHIGLIVENLYHANIHQTLYRYSNDDHVLVRRVGSEFQMYRLLWADLNETLSTLKREVGLT
jgi:hypothetical protein